jgi:hypothetical protein
LKLLHWTHWIHCRRNSGGGEQVLKLLARKVADSSELGKAKSLHSSMAAHTDLKSMGIMSSSAKGHFPFPGFTVMGQWIKYRSMYSN